MGFQHGLDACVILNGGTTVVSDKTMASTVEAVVGAVELDCGSQAMMQVATRLGLVHASLAPVMSNFPLPYSNRMVYTINLVTFRALPLAILPSSTHSILTTVARAGITCPD